ncbi:hypothetical protein ACIBSV_42860 [Embleya sp. NPDC050154]|uniref:hypothetical protein n=1 Tax=Embleya sp. NPDC050154 TaxID=3363988 RepID=UPI0037B068DC
MWERLSGRGREVRAFPNPVAESLLDRLINTSHQVMNGPSYRPNKRPKNPAGKIDTSPIG